MCGITGVIKFGDTKLNPKSTIMSLLGGIQNRGLDAVGVAWETQNDPITYYVKQQGLVNSFNPDIPDDAVVLLGHVRHATHGSPNNNENNHPLYGDRYVIVHNGVVNPKRIDGYRYKGETDTEIMLSYVEKYGWDGVPKSPGSKVVGIWDMETKELFLYTSDSSLHAMFYKNCLLWCSEESPLLSLRNEKEDDPILTMLEIKKETGYIFKPYSNNVTVIRYEVKPNLGGVMLADSPGYEYTYQGMYDYNY
jgi:predicted glutamine amidotransferase